MHQTIKKCYISVNVQKVDFDINSEIKKIKSNKIIGGIVNFTGIVRNSGGEKEELVSLELEHYPGMTEQKLNAIEEQARSKWELLGSKLIHRVGKLSADDQIVFVGVASGHREDAFLAAQYIMDFLKNEAPFWKKQKTQHGDGWISSRKSDLAAINKWK